MNHRRVIVFLLLSLFGASLQAKTLDTCFSPLGHCDQVMVTWINAAQKSLDGAIYGLTDQNIAQALMHARERGVQVRLVHDASQAAGQSDITQQLLNAGVSVHVQRGSEGGILHDKFLIIDSSYVLTGSFNWTNNATQRNDENFVVLDDQTPKFQAEFERLWSSPTAAAYRYSHPYFSHPRKIVLTSWKYPSYYPKPHHHRRRRKKKKTPLPPPPVVVTPIINQVH